MADGKVKLEVEVTGKNAKLVQRQVEGVTSAVNENTVAQNKNAKASSTLASANDHYARGLKGVAGVSSSSTKNFSKMRDAMEGSSGLVGAYATLAANLFAATAAFEAFRKAADVEKVIKSIEILGTTSGTNIKRIGENIQRITGFGLSLGDSMKAASLGVSAGFDSTQLETLAKVAKGASAALGRDLADSYDRLIRGAAKLEPEILDELGIIVRIDKASRDYAIALGKNVNELTQYEKTQAFVNAINTQGIAKFGLLAEAVETSPYDKLAASLSNLSTSFLNFISSTAKLPEFLTYLSQNLEILAGAVTLFVSTISRQMLPVLYEGPRAAAEEAQLAATEATSAADKAKNASQELGKSTKDLPAGYKKLLPSIQAGTASIEDQNKAVNSLRKSISYYDRAIESGKDLRGKALSPEKLTEYTARQAALTSELRDFENVQKGVSKTQIAASRALANQNALTAKSNALMAASTLDLGGAVSNMGSAFTAYRQRALASSAATSTLSKSVATLKATFLTAALGARVFGSALLAFLPYLGLLVTFGPIVKDWFMNKFFPEDMVKKRQKVVEEMFSKVTELTSFLSRANLRFEINAQSADFNAPIEGLKLIASSFREIRTSINSLLDEINQKSAEISKKIILAPLEGELTRARQAVQDNKKELADAQKELETYQKIRGGAKPTSEQLMSLTAFEGDVDKAIKAIQGNVSRLQNAGVVLTQKLNAAQQAYISGFGEAAFEGTRTTILAAKELIPSQLEEALNTVRNSSAYKALSEDVQSQVLNQATLKLQAASDKYATDLSYLNYVINNAISDGNGTLTAQQQATFSAQYKELEQSFRNLLSASTSNLEQFSGQVNGMGDAVTGLLKSISEAGGKISTPYDEVLKSITSVMGGISGNTEDVQILNAELRKIFGEKYSDQLNFDLNTMRATLEAAVSASAGLATEQAKLQNLESLSSGLQSIAGIDLIIQKQKIKVLNDQITIRKADLALARASGQSAQNVAEIENNIVNLQEQKKNAADAEIRAQQKILDVKNKIFASEKQIFDLSLETQRNRLLLTQPTGTLTTRQEDQLVRDQYAARLAFAEKEYNLKVEGIKLEYALLDAQYKMFKVEAERQGLIDTEAMRALDSAIGQLGQARDSQLGAAYAELENQRSKLAVDFQKATVDLASKVNVSVGGVMKNISDIFYEDIKNTVVLSTQLAQSFANTLDSTIDAFVNAIVEGKNVFTAIKNAFKDTLREGLAEAAKSQLKLGVKVLFENFGLELFADPVAKAADSTASAAQQVATSAEKIATSLSNCCMSATTTTLTGGQGEDILSSGGAITDKLEETSTKSQNIFERMFGGIKSLLGLTKEGNESQDKGFSLLSSGIGQLGGALLAKAGPGVGKTGGMIGGTLMNAGLASGNMWLAGAGAVASFLGFAKGGVMSSSGPMPLQKYARGGIASSPQLAMFGEGSKPEAYVPLPDGRTIPVTMSSGSANVNNISVNVAVEGGQAQAQTTGGADNTEDYSRRLGVAITNAVKQEIFNQQRPGGLLYKGRR